MPDTTAPRGTLFALTFSAPVTNPYGLTDVGAGANPSFADIDGDGDLDAFIGADGDTLVSLNTGSASSPAFAAPVTNPYGLTNFAQYASPSLADIDGDGDLDAFIGDRSGNTRVALNTGSATSPAFAAPATNPYGLTDAGSNASPRLADIDGDGDLDAFIGNSIGSTLVSLNTGSATSPAFAAPVTNPYGLTDVGNDASPRLADIDGDGDLDAFVGERYGTMLVFLNTGSATSPAFAAPVTTPYGLTDVGDYAIPSLADIDGDGDLDALVGNNAGNTLVYLSTGGSFVAPVTTSTANSTYAIGSVITLSVAFSESVIVDPSGGAPTLSLETGATDRLATYSGGSGTSTLSFSYTVQAGDTSADLDFTGTSALTLNGATIRDAAGNNAVLTLATPGAAGSLAANAALVIDGAAPTATLAAASIKSTGSATVQSTEAGNAYLVSTAITVSNVASITGAADASWNTVALAAANTNTALAATGLSDGSYKLYTTDAVGNLSAASSGMVTVDSTAPHGTLARTPVFSAPVANPYGLTDVGGYANPSFADIDGDGDLDAFTANGSGNTLVSLNTGSATSPAFAAPVTNPYGLTNVGIRASPSFADIDGDGDLDAFVGNGSGNTLVSLNTGSATAPAFAAPVTNPYGLPGVGNWASPSIADIDGDGDLDVFIGGYDGNTRVSLNTGSATSPAFAAPVTNRYGLTDVGGFASPSLADIDGDGDLDALIGNGDGNTRVYLNTGSATSPAFAAAVTNPYGLTDVGGHASPSLVDIDGDGDLDVFIGEQFGNTLFSLNTGSFVAPVTSGTANGSYGIGSVITLTVAFLESVMVDTSAGVPTLSLETGATDRLATYSSGSGTSLLTFTYTVQAGDSSMDLDFTGTSALTLNGATIRDAAGNNAILTLAAPGATGSLAANAALVIDTTAPTATLTAATLANTSSATVQSTETGTAYLVNASVAVTNVASITSAADASWNSAPIAAANTTTALAATGLSVGSYKLYTADAAGNLSAASAGSVTIDSAPTATLTSALIPSTGSVTVQSTETGNAYLVNTSVVVTSVASITSAADASWNSVAIIAANIDTALAATGLSDGSYKLYTTDPLGLLSAASTGVVTVDSTAPRGSLAGTPVFSAPVTNLYGLTDVGDRANPSFADIDGDGDPDAIIGGFDGNTRIFLNTGSAISPAFAAPVTNPYGLTDVGFDANPSFADIDGDGDLDALIGNSNGNSLVSLNTGSATSPAFAAPVTNPYGLADVGDYASPSFADIDGDGDLDAFVGEYFGNTLVSLNTGSATSPAFSAPVTNPYGLADVGDHANPSLADIDGDGDLDAFIGDSLGNTLVYLNTGSATSPAFAAPVSNPHGLTNVGNYASPSLADIDGDGDLDAFIGNSDGITLVYLNTGSFVAPVASSTANGSYGIGSVITLRVAFTENVIVDTSAGVPRLSLETGATDRFATYSGGSGTSTLTFTYTVQAGDTSADLDFTGSSALALNGATIRDAVGHDAILTLAAPGAQGSLAANAALVITGNNEVLTGTAGADTLDGGSGADTMSGGDGNDRYDVDNAGDVVVETNPLPAGGTDTVYSTVSYTLTDNVERGSINTSGAANLTGNGLNNILYAGSGNNVLDGAGGTDMVSYASAASGVNINLALSGAQNTGGSGSDTFISIESLFGSAFNDVLTGNAGANNLQGRVGADTLDGGLGADTMTGGDDNDRYWVDDAGDRVVEVADGGADTVYSSLASYTLTTNVERGVVNTSAAADLTGNALNNILTAGSGANVIDGTGGTDLVSYASASSAVTVSLALSGAQNTGGSGSDTLVSIENLTGSAHNDSLTGDAGANSLSGGTGSGADTLDGGLGADTMTGGDGNDRYHVDDAGDQVVELTGGGSDHVYSTLASYTLTDNVERGTINTSAASDLTGNALDNILYAGAGDNVLDGAGGVDLVSYASASSGVTVSLALAGPQNTGASGSDTLISIENLFGSAHADSLTGDAGANNLQGGSGADALDGGLGADTITGGGGNDTITGGSGADTFVFGNASGKDQISGFSFSDGDMISLLANLNGSGIVDGASALAHLSDVSGNAVLDLDGGHKLTLIGVLSADFSVNDFLFY